MSTYSPAALAAIYMDTLQSPSVLLEVAEVVACHAALANSQLAAQP
jgi:hypothetical protein